ncbi:DUF397 domain-containing protein [Streptomyces spongiae]|uniref:DUF397 domain-containing protein n=1 Tax=Streptomyces spongiae TaxID=565072 RepID=A0A5N8Y0H9_9ACTN|nr:DUF397 domain-containing protein [Streptomyces spongiae]MPY64928.1 DUF397 domain-containing protein [Streptomyces spongiae]
MPTLHWQKSTYSGDGSNCVHLAASAGGAIHLRESDAPHTILTTTQSPLHALIRTLKALPPKGGRSGNL